LIFLSSLLRQSIYDKENQHVGVVRDVSVSLAETFPVITALLVHTSGGSGNRMIPWSQVESIEELPVRLMVNQAQLTSYEPHCDELLLGRDILDKQIVDTQGFRVVKVNDLKIAQIKKTARLVGVDISLSGLLRRLGLQSALDSLSRVLPVQLSERTITWNYVEPVQIVRAGNTGQLIPTLVGATTTAGGVGVIPQVQLNVSHTKLADLHPADLADILEQLDIEEAGAMLDRLDNETAADTLNEVTYPRQTEILSELEPERASDLLGRMPPDDAADILEEMPYEEAERLLSLMSASNARSIRDLLRYGAETAGGIMTTQVLALSQESTVEDALTYLRQHSKHLEMIYYLYVVDGEQHLQGVVSLRQIVTAEPATRIASLMDPDVIKVQIDTDQEEVARIIAKYDLLAVPVVDTEHHLKGLITVDDVIDVIHEEQAEDLSEIAGAEVEELEEDERFSVHIVLRRFTWLAVNIVAGFILALVIYRHFNLLFSGQTLLAALTGATAASGIPSRLALGSLICFTPMLLLTSSSLSAQTLGIAWKLRTKRGRAFFRGFLHELLLDTAGSVLASLLVVVLTWILFSSLLLSMVIGLAFVLTLFSTAICGLALPNLFSRLRLHGSLMTAPLLNPVIAVISMNLFLLVTLMLIEKFTL
jgi:Mg2+ transporter MgtE